MSEFFNMGGYAGYVWPAYGIVALVLAGLAVSTLVTLRRREREVERLRASMPRRRRRGAPDSGETAATEETEDAPR